MVEAGGVVPTIPLLERISAALDADLIVELAPQRSLNFQPPLVWHAISSLPMSGSRTLGGSMANSGGWHDVHVEGHGFRRRIVVSWITLERESDRRQGLPLGILASRRPPAVDVQGRHAVVPVAGLLVPEQLNTQRAHNLSPYSFRSSSTI
jgi:hypothetical protein